MLRSTTGKKARSKILDKVNLFSISSSFEWERKKKEQEEAEQARTIFEQLTLIRQSEYDKISLSFNADLPASGDNKRFLLAEERGERIASMVECDDSKSCLFESSSRCL